MLDLKTYTETELSEILGVKTNTLRRTYKDNLRNYFHSERYKVSKGVFAYDILGYKEEEKSEFIQICEQIAGKEIAFPRQQTAEHLLKILLTDDCTILSNEELGWYFPGGLEQHSVGRYLKLFREYKLLPKPLPKIKRITFDKETGEILSKWQDYNSYVYYKVLKRLDVREEIEEKEYFEMHSFIRKKYGEYMNMNIDACHGNAQNIKTLVKEAAIAAQLECAAFYEALPRKAFTKIPTREAFHLLMPYFDLSVNVDKPVQEVEVEEDNFSHLTLQERNIENFLRELYSVIGKDPLQKDWDRPGKFEDEYEQRDYYEINRLKEDLNYFRKLRLNGKLTEQTKQNINKLLKVKWDKLVSLMDDSEVFNRIA
ncbi:hypothetical protein [Peribacillus butanolivorans]|uniref:hypothetical protein n=1 Tax=Peribacillus butanolivorans TaxID=421767 RepID=UPI0038038E4B